MATTFIYALCEPGTRKVRYIGMTCDLARRLQEHVRDTIKLKTHLGYWMRSLVSIGKIPHLFKLCEVEAVLGSETEIKFIRLARESGIRLVNGTDGGEGVQNPSLETRAKRSAALTPETRKKMSEDNSGDNNPFFGRKHTKTSKAKMSLLNSGKNNPMFGRSLPKWNHTEEAKAKMRRPRSEESKAKQRATVAAKKEAK